MNILIIITTMVLFEIFAMKVFFKKMRTKKIDQPFYELGPDHQKKKGTPTMGGITLLVVATIGLILTFMLTEFNNTIEFIAILIVITFYGSIGFQDDYLKITKSNNQSGLTPNQKLILQLIAAMLVSICLIISGQTTEINFVLVTSDLNYFYYIIVLLMMVGFSNATNLTDGIDGLLTTNFIVTMSFLTFISFLENNNFLFLFGLGLISVLTVFLVYNKYPAKVFMGDTGSLFLGAIFVIYSVFLKIEFISIFFVSIFLFETVSVIIQVLYFKYTKKRFGSGKKFFLMAPLHHHYEKKGLTEKQIVKYFVIIQALFSIIGLSLYWIGN